MRQLESRLEQRVVEEAKKRGAICFKLNNRASVGWPDRLFLFSGGRILFIEFKREGEVPRPLQHYRLQQLRDAGYDAVWCDNFDDAMVCLARAVEASRRSEEGS